MKRDKNVNKNCQRNITKGTLFGYNCWFFFFYTIVFICILLPPHCLLRHPRTYQHSHKKKSKYNQLQPIFSVCLLFQVIYSDWVKRIPAYSWKLPIQWFLTAGFIHGAVGYAGIVKCCVQSDSVVITLGMMCFVCVCVRVCAHGFTIDWADPVKEVLRRKGNTFELTFKQKPNWGIKRQ